MTFHQGIVWANLLCALLAFVLTAAAACCGVRRSRWMFAAIAPIALIYAIGYAWLLANWGSVLRWSEFYRGVSLAAWPIAWWLPAGVALVRGRTTVPLPKVSVEL